MNVGKMRLQVCKEDIIRVQYTTASSIPEKPLCPLIKFGTHLILKLLKPVIQLSLLPHV
jgi:hypothetical protein